MAQPERFLLHDPQYLLVWSAVRVEPEGTNMICGYYFSLIVLIEFSTELCRTPQMSGQDREPSLRSAFRWLMAPTAPTRDAFKGKPGEIRRSNTILYTSNRIDHGSRCHSPVKQRVPVIIPAESGQSYHTTGSSSLNSPPKSTKAEADEET